MQTPTKPTILLDSSPLITLSKYRAKNVALIQIVLGLAEVHITPEVEKEVVGAKAKPGAELVRSLIRKGAITVVPAPAEPLVHNFYPLDEAECTIIRLGLTRPQAWTILDDTDAYLAAIRYGLLPMDQLLATPDMLLRLVREHGLPASTALAMVQSAAKRFSPYYVAHTLAMLKELGA